MITVNSRKYDGSIRRSWQCELIERKGPLVLLRGEFNSDVEHPDLGLVAKGTISYEYYWLDRWYNIFRFHQPSGELRNFYCNINMPPRFEEGVLDYIDLDIDILVWPDHTYAILDREDYERHASAFGYPKEVEVNVEAAVKRLVEMVESGKLKL